MTSFYFFQSLKSPTVCSNCPGTGACEGKSWRCVIIIDRWLERHLAPAQCSPKLFGVAEHVSSPWVLTR